MDSKLPLYQWLVTLIPGSGFVLAIYGLLHHFDTVPSILAINNVAIELFAFLIVGLVAGELLQAVSSTIEPLMLKSWGGRPSSLIAKQSKYDAYFAELKRHFGEKLSSDELFERAMALCNNRALGRTEYFNVLYGYARSLFVGAILLTLLTIYLMFSTNHVDDISFGIVASTVIVALLFWSRAKKRGANYAKEVIVQATLALEMK